MDINLLLRITGYMLEGLMVSFKIFGLSIIFVIPLGIILAIGKSSKIKIVSLLVNSYVNLIRGVPIILVIIFVYFAPYYIFYRTLTRFTAVVVAMVLFFGAYMAEIFRSGMISVPKGQHEVAFKLGYNKFQAFILIIFPQVIKNILPSMANEVINLFKGTSLAPYIGVTEMFSIAQKYTNLYLSILPLFISGLIYLIFCTIISYIFKFIEKKLSYYHV